MKQLTPEAADRLSAAVREIGIGRQDAEAFIAEAASIAELDGADAIYAGHMATALASRVERADGSWTTHSTHMQERTCSYTG
jgi:hypothetical protein